MSVAHPKQSPSKCRGGWSIHHFSNSRFYSGAGVGARWGGLPYVVFPSRRDGAATPTGSDPEYAFRTAAQDYSVIAWMRSATVAAVGSVAPADSAIILVMSPWTLILPAMNACMPACGLPSTMIAFAVS